jgi:hypothetical protein
VFGELIDKETGLAPVFLWIQESLDFNKSLNNKAIK